MVNQRLQGLRKKIKDLIQSILSKHYIQLIHTSDFQLDLSLLFLPLKYKSSRSLIKLSCEFTGFVNLARLSQLCQERWSV